MSDQPVSNIPEFSVSDIAGAIRRTLEAAFSRVRVRGEITELKTYPSGHTYLSLKDEGGKIRAVIWKGARSKIGLAPENGMEVIATGKITAYSDRSEYQLTIERLEFAGVGAMLARIESLRLKLLGEGLFAEERKKPLPKLPFIIGVITSSKGAVLHDICVTIERRFPRKILLWPVPVQGEGAAQKIAEAIAGMDRLPQGRIPRPDVLIVARGGGSLEDLMAFNDEAVVRAAAACAIPLISAVGHETDTTLIDFASSRRAPTPTAAAELAVPLRAAMLADLAQTEARLLGGITRLTQTARARLTTAANRLPDLPAALAQARMRLDDRAERLAPALPRYLALRRSQLAGLRVPPPKTVIAQRRQKLEKLAGQLKTASPEHLLTRQRQALALLAARLEGASYASVLARGFVMVRDAAGKPVTAAASVAPGAALTLGFADGTVAVTAC
jgi:exodeoxyribonuclease VII large subunit